MIYYVLKLFATAMLFIDIGWSNSYRSIKNT